MSNKYPGGIITSGANAGYSVAFDGTGDFLSLATNAAFNFGSGAFTVECWFYPNTISGTQCLVTNYGSSTTGFVIQMGGSSAGSGRIDVNLSGDGADIAGTAVLTAGTWNHIAVSGTPGASGIRLFVNGVQTGSTYTGSTTLDTSSSLLIGSVASTNYVNGYISNVRIVKGTALYTAAFTPPTQLFAITNTSLLTCNSPAIVDQSSNAFTITANGNAAVSTFTPFTGTQLVPNPNTLANTQGVWSISDAAYWVSQNKWPMPPSYPLQSLRFNSADSPTLTRTPASSSNRRTWTWSGWVKRSAAGGRQTIFGVGTGTNNGSWSVINFEDANLGWATYLFGYKTSAVFRDFSAWYHIVVAIDTTQATAANRIKMYINGVEQVINSEGGTITQNDEYGVNTTNQHAIGYNGNLGGGAAYLSGYLTNVHFIDGQALTPSSFGANDPNTGVWSPVPYSGTYGTNGFRLSFQDNTGTTATTLGKDWSGQGNNWTPNNFSVAAGSGNDSLTDGPTNWGIDYGNGGEVRGNYATINPLMTPQFSQTYSNGNLECTGNYAYVNAQSTICVSSGKWYAEAVFNVKNSAGQLAVGVFNKSRTNYIGNSPGNTGAVGYWSNGEKSIDGTTSAYGATYGVNDVIGVAMDITNNTITFYKNNVSQGAISYTFDTSGAWGFLTDGGGSFAAGDKVTWNFGQRPFAYPAPSGFKVLCTTNLPIPTVGATSTTLANKYMDVSLYTGTGAVQSVTNSGSMQPDFVWLKNRNSTEWHSLFDAVRGALQNIRSNSTNAEVTATGTLTSFNSNGFSLGTDPSSYGVNTNTFTYVAWQWKANGAGVSNTAGSITSTVSANQTAGFSVVTYTTTAGTKTVGHGLGAVPRMLIVKPRNVVGEWYVYHGSLSNTQYLWLNSTNAVATDANLWASTTPTSTVFTLGSSWGAGNNFVAYCFAEIAGFSKFGSYTGNGSTDGPFVYCGFRPRFIFFKRTDSTGSWNIFDTARNTYNATDLALFPNLTNADTTQGTAGNLNDILSNGFKLRGTGVDANASGGTYIYMAFAESPFNYSRAR